MQKRLFARLEGYRRWVIFGHFRCSFRHTNIKADALGMGPHPDYQFGYIQRIDPKTGDATLL